MLGNYLRACLVLLTTEVPIPSSNSKTPYIKYYLYADIFMEVSCPIKGQEYKECGTACSVKCQNLHPAPYAPDCVQGCQCLLGTVLDEENNKRVSIVPFHHVEHGMVICNIATYIVSYMII